MAALQASLDASKKKTRERPGEAPQGRVTREELYGLPGAEFVAARDALARSLAKDKQRDEAAAVKALRRPTRSAEALNHLARNEPKAIARLTGAGDKLREALEAGKRDGVDAARRDVSAAIDELLGGGPRRRAERAGAGRGRDQPAGGRRRHRVAAIGCARAAWSARSILPGSRRSPA